MNENEKDKKDKKGRPFAQPQAVKEGFNKSRTETDYIVTDPDGSYTGIPYGYDIPIQDADDL